MQVFIARAHVNYESDMCQHVFFSFEKASEYFDASKEIKVCCKCKHGFDEMTLAGPFEDGEDLFQKIIASCSGRLIALGISGS